MGEPDKLSWTPFKGKSDGLVEHGGYARFQACFSLWTMVVQGFMFGCDLSLHVLRFFYLHLGSILIGFSMEYISVDPQKRILAG